jgi:MFS family permease
LLEVPSGYFSDAVGRKPTLLISSLGLLAAYALFFVGGSFAVFAAAQVCFAVAWSFNSGTDVSFHYDSLASLDRQEEFDSREAVAARNNFGAAALAAFFGGCAGLFGLRWAYGLSFASAAVAFILVLRFAEPATHERATVLGRGFARQLLTCAGYLRRPTLLWLFVFAVLMTVLNHVPYEFYQPYIRLVSSRTLIAEGGTPFAVGVHTSITLFVGAWIAARSIRLRDRLGLGPALLCATVLQLVIMATMGLVLHAVVVALVLLRSCPRAMMAAPLNAAIAPRVPQQQRATYLSIQSLVGRLSFSGTLVLLSLASSDVDDWQSISRMLMVSAVGGSLVFLVLLATVRAARTRRE